MTGWIANSEATRQGKESLRSIISVVQRKGGAGKTTVAIALAGELHRRGRAVDVIDADPQRSAAEWAAPGKLPFRVSEMPLRIGGAAQWARLIRSAPGAMTIIDTPPQEYAVGAAATIADVVILPCPPSGVDLAATEQTLSVIAIARKKRGTHVPVLVVPNRVDARTLEGQQIMGALAELGEFVCKPIASRLTYVRSFSMGMLPEGQAVLADYGNLSEQVLKAIRSR